MLQVNNKSVIKKLSARTSKNSRARNIFAVIAIALVTLMITVVGSFTYEGYLLYEQNSKNDLRQGDAILSSATKEQAEAAGKEAYVKTAVREVPKGYTENAGKTKKLGILYYFVDKELIDYLKENNWGEVKGSYPDQADEVMLPGWTLERMGIDKPEIGMEIVVKASSGQKDEQGKRLPEEEKKLTLSGYFDDKILSADLADAATAFVSEDFSLSGSEELERGSTLAIWFTKASETDKNIELLAKDLSLDASQSLQENTQSSFDQEKMSTLMVGVLIALLAMFSGYLLIYNIFYLSVSRDIRYYGLLKTIGTTPKQLKKLIRNQGIKLAVIGIPIGIAVSILVYGVIFPLVQNSLMNGERKLMGLSLSPIPLFIGCVFAFLTLLISIRKPAKKISRITPVEAVRYLNGEAGGKRKKKDLKSYGGGKISKMALRNVFRDKKRASVVLLSLILGVTVFMAVFVLSTSMNVEGYADYNNFTDFSLECSSEKTIFNEKFIGQVKDIDGVDKVYEASEAAYTDDLDKDMYNGLTEMINDVYGTRFERKDIKREFGGLLVGMDDQLWEDHSDELKKGRETLKDNEVLTALDFSKKMKLPESIQVTVDGKKADLKYLGSASASLPLVAEKNGPYYFMKKSSLEKIAGPQETTALYIDAKPGRDAQVDQALKRLVEPYGDDLFMTGKPESREIMREMLNYIHLLGGGIAFILAFVGIVNFVNIMFTSIHVRRQELSVMESIGMTQKQIRKMLLTEGAYYGLISLGISLTVGNGLIYLAYKMMEGVIPFMKFTYPAAPILLVYLLIAAACTAVPLLSYRQFSKISLPERLRYE